jgi:hypothetical protein
MHCEFEVHGLLLGLFDAGQLTLTAYAGSYQDWATSAAAPMRIL